MRGRKYLVTFNVDKSIGSMYVLASSRPTAEDLEEWGNLIKETSGSKRVLITNFIEVTMNKKEKTTFVVQVVSYTLFLIALGIGCALLTLAFFWLLSNIGGRGVII